MYKGNVCMSYFSLYVMYASSGVCICRISFWLFILCTNVSDLRHLESILCGIFDEMSVWQLQWQGDEAAGRRLEEQPCRGRRGAAGSLKELLSRGRH